MNTTQTSRFAALDARMADEARRTTYTTTATGSATYPDFTTAYEAGLATNAATFTVHERRDGRRVRGMAWPVQAATVRATHRAHTVR